MAIFKLREYMTNVLNRNMHADRMTLRRCEQLALEALESRCVLAVAAASATPIPDAVPINLLDSSSSSDMVTSGFATSALASDGVERLTGDTIPEWAVQALQQDSGQLIDAFAFVRAVVVHYEDAMGNPEVLFKDDLLRNPVSLVDFVETRARDQIGNSVRVTDIRDLTMSIGDRRSREAIREIRGTAMITNNLRSTETDFVIFVATPKTTSIDNSRPFRRIRQPLPIPVDFVGPRLPVSQVVSQLPAGTASSFDRLPVPSDFDRFRIEFFGSSSPIDPDDGNQDDEQQQLLPDEDAPETLEPMPEGLERYGSGPNGDSTRKSEDSESDRDKNNSMHDGPLEEDADQNANDDESVQETDAEQNPSDGEKPDGNTNSDSSKRTDTINRDADAQQGADSEEKGHKPGQDQLPNTQVDQKMNTGTVFALLPTPTIHGSVDTDSTIELPDPNLATRVGSNALPADRVSEIAATLRRFIHNIISRLMGIGS